MIEDDYEYALLLGELCALSRSPTGPVQEDRIEALNTLVTAYESSRGMDIPLDIRLKRLPVGLSNR